MQVCAHPFFDELRNPETRLPDGGLLPPLFNFTVEELGACSPELRAQLVPAHARTPDNWPELAGGGGGGGGSSSSGGRAGHAGVAALPSPQSPAPIASGSLTVPISSRSIVSPDQPPQPHRASGGGLAGSDGRPLYPPHPRPADGRAGGGSSSDAAAAQRAGSASGGLHALPAGGGSDAVPLGAPRQQGPAVGGGAAELLAAARQ